MSKNFIVQVLLMNANDWDADALEYLFTVNSSTSPSQHLMSLHPSVLWISTINQGKQLSSFVSSLVIQSGVGKEEKVFNLSNLPSLTTLEMGGSAFENCHSIVLKSENDEWMINQIFLNYSLLFLDQWLYLVIAQLVIQVAWQWRVWMIEEFIN